MTCAFCRIALHESPAEVVYEDERIIAFRDLHPKMPVHILIAPKDHVATLNDFHTDQAQLVGELVLAAQRIAAGEGIDEYRLQANVGRGAGQTVFHFHFHLMGGKRMAF